MTSTDEHPEAAEISALTEGALPPERSAGVRGHLAHCPQCADVRTSLEEIRDLLGTSPAVPMPAEVAERIDAALAAAAVSAPARMGPRLPVATVPAPAVSRETGPPTPSDRVSRETSRTSESPWTGRPVGHGPAPSGPVRRRPGSRRRKGLIAAVSAAAVLGFGGILVSSLGSGGGHTRSQSPGSAETKALRTHVLALVATSSSTTKLPQLGGPTGDRPLLGSTFVTPSCVQRGIGSTAQPLAAERYTYRGTASYLVVLAHPSDAAKVDAYVVDAACASASPARPGRVLDQETYTR